KQSGHLLWHFDTDSDQVGPGAGIVPESAGERFVRLWQGRLDSDHDPLQIVSRPDRRRREDVVEGAKDGFGFIISQLINGQPEAGNAAILQAAFHQREKLLSVKVNRSWRLQRRRFACNDVVVLRTSLHKKTAILDEGPDARIAQRIRVTWTRIKIGKIEDFL